MIVSDFINEKIRVMTEKLDRLKTLSTLPVEFEYVSCPEYKTTNTPPDKNADWQKFIPGISRLTGVDMHYWLHMTVNPAKAQEYAEPRLCCKTGREGQWDAINPQFTVMIDGKTAQAMDTNHTWLPLEFDKKYDIYIYAYTGMNPNPLGIDLDITLEIIDLKIESLYYDIKVPYDSMQLLDSNSTDYTKIRRALDRAALKLDLRDVYSSDFYSGIDAAAKYLKEEFYDKLTPSDNIVSCIGHTHIDVAWLWTVAQTKEKAQRSFSTVLNLMKRYKDYIFMSSQPQLYQHVKDNDPELFERIKEYVKAGKWEVEGAMWLEADTNLASGESLVRQILFGKRFMKEEFDVDSKILWLPDVFGYSGALPQILKKSGVTQFMTAKMSWNETNSMPNDIFKWEGIDGSDVFAVLIPGYVNTLNPENVKRFWDSYKNKSLIPESLLTFGYGDGGGGPAYDMLENYKRLKHGIPGMPTPVIEKSGEYFDRIEKKFNELSPELVTPPKWVGEMYLEMHRGTYTSIAKNKKNNRKSELCYLEAEAVSVTDMVLNGGEYPEDILRKNQQNILLNQFHDIIPGSSIKEVYDVTDKEYSVILGEGRQIIDDKLSSIKSNIKTDGGIFVYNPTPFEISDYIEFDGKTVYAENIPAHGCKVIKNEEAVNKVNVKDKLLENDVVKVTFNDKYHIISIFDKLTGREVLSENAEANRIEIFEDYPREYDAWEITDYYAQKMWIADNVSEVTPIKNGLRIKRNYQKSTITQDITLRNGSKRIDFKTIVDWHEDHVLMKAAFPVDIHSTNATYDIQFGNVERPTHYNTSWDETRFEVCAHKWADLSENGYGAAILNDCKYGYSIRGSIMKISLLKAATYPNPEADRGINEFTYSFMPHEGDFREGNVIKEGYLLNMPLEASLIGASDGKTDNSISIASSDCDNVIVETIKKAENDDSVIIRAYEAHNKKSNAKITVGFDFKEVYLCNLLEENIEKLNHNGRSVTLPVKNFEIITLKFIR